MNARQIDGWAFDREVDTKTGERTFAFFTDRDVAEREAERMSLLEPINVVAATLILPSAQKGEVG